MSAPELIPKTGLPKVKFNYKKYTYKIKDLVGYLKDETTPEFTK